MFLQGKTMSYTYNQRENIRTSFEVEKLYNTHKGFIGRLPEVEYKQSNGTWKSAGSRWLINVDDIQTIMDEGFKSTQL